MHRFYDLEPEPKSREELYLLILMDTKGKKVNYRKFYRSEILQAQKFLIKNGYLSGGVDSEEVWFTNVLPKGEYFIEKLQKQLNIKNPYIVTF